VDRAAGVVVGLALLDVDDGGRSAGVQEFNEWFDDLPASEAKAVAHVVGLLQEFGLALGPRTPRRSREARSRSAELRVKHATTVMVG
jgi:hypothetical protein